MADLGFPLAIQLRQGAAERRIEEDRVVSESIGAARLGHDLTFDRAFRFEKDRFTLRDGNRAHEPRRAPGDAAFAEQLLDLPELRWIVGAVPARRMNAGSLVECVD